MIQYREIEFVESACKHGIEENEIEECLFNEEEPPLILRSTQDQRVKVAYGRTFGGRYLKTRIKKE